MIPAAFAYQRASTVDEAVDLLGEQGVRAVTHRAVDAAAGLPVGATSNLFRTREALFSILEHGEPPVRGARFLDLFCGTGAVGLEAASRGAAKWIFSTTSSGRSRARSSATVGPRPCEYCSVASIGAAAFRAPRTRVAIRGMTCGASAIAGARRLWTSTRSSFATR